MSQLVPNPPSGPGGLAELPAAPGRIEQVLPALEPALSTALEVLGDVLPWWVKLPAKAGIKGLKRRLADRQFRHLLGLLLDYALYSDVDGEELRDLRFVGRLAHTRGVKLSLDASEKIVDCVRVMLLSPSVERVLTNPGDVARLALARRKMSFVRGASRGAQLQMARKQAGAFESGVEVLMRPFRTEHDRDPDSVSRLAREDNDRIAILDFIGECCRELLDEPSQDIDVNLMISSPPTEAEWRECQVNRDAARIFEREGFDAADKILRVRWATTGRYHGFWIPVFAGVGNALPGAPSAYADHAPRVVFARDLDPFGGGLSGDMVNRLKAYLANAPFRVFLSFPVGNGGNTQGAVNVNLYNEEHKFRLPAEVQRAFLSVRPLLAILARL